MSARKPILLVEGKDDLHAIVHLMKHYVIWPDEKASVPVEIHEAKSVTEILDASSSSLISTLWKSTPTLGVILDADEDFNSRWSSLRNIFNNIIPGIPQIIPQGGLVIANPDDGKRLGAWIMPNNNSSGMLETFLNTLVPEEGKNLWNHSCESTEKAKSEHCAPYVSAHVHKAQINSWLAWQNPPGLPFGTAIKAKILDPTAQSAQVFAKWFCNLYELPSLCTDTE